MREDAANRRRLAVMRGEAARRSATWAAIGIDTGDEEDSLIEGPVRLLVYGRGVHGPLLRQLNPENVEAIQAFPGRALAAAVTSGNYDAAVVDSDVRDAAQQIATLRRDPRYADWPVLAIADVPTYAAELSAAGASLVFSAADLEGALAELPVLVRERIMRNQLGDFLRAHLSGAAASGAAASAGADRAMLADRSLLDHHLERTLAAARAGDESASPTSLLVLRSADEHALPPVQIGNLIAQIVRGEDLPARVDGNTLGIMMPGADSDMAAVVRDRLQGFLAATRTGPGVHNIGRGVITAVATSDGDEDAGGLLKRALESLVSG